MFVVGQRRDDVLRYKHDFNRGRRAASEHRRSASYEMTVVVVVVAVASCIAAVAVVNTSTQKFDKRNDCCIYVYIFPRDVRRFVFGRLAVVASALIALQVVVCCSFVRMFIRKTDNRVFNTDTTNG